MAAAKAGASLASRLKDLPPLSLKEFMSRQRVLRLYREVLKIARHTKPSDREEVRQWARGEIERYRNETDAEKISHLLNYGSQQLHSLRGAIVNSTTRKDIRGPSQSKG
ncbi:hypothetical protein DFJ74DRAFT_652141 [Hyaloraphidium curvatum]|nr:hypothetical protein DFJ74DRAFT_652141 [Hyaloraphidium curvatum]